MRVGYCINSTPIDTTRAAAASQRTTLPPRRRPTRRTHLRQNTLNMEPLGERASDFWYSSMRISVHVPAPPRGHLLRVLLERTGERVGGPPVF